jgi:hypothetical protein
MLPGDPDTADEPADPVRRLHPPAALALGVAVGLVAAPLFALRMGAILGPLAVVLALVGVNARRLFGLGALVLGLVPIAYLVRPAPRFGALSFDFARLHLGAHWIAVVAVWLLAAGCVLSAAAWRRRRAPPPARPS